MSIVTKGGDSGETGLLYGGRVPKDDLHTEAYGSLDEAISALGLARSLETDAGRAATHGAQVRDLTSKIRPTPPQPGRHTPEF